MAYQILRQEQEIDNNGDKEIFMSVQVTDDTGLFVRGEWLSADDVAAVVANPDYNDTVAAQIAARAIAAKMAPAPIQGFSTALFYRRMSEVLTIPQQTQLAQMAPNFMIALQVQDFTNVKQIMDYVVSQQPEAEAMDTIIRALLLEQGINLATF